MSAPKFLATGRCLPAKVVTNDDLSRTVDKGDIVRSMKLQKAINTGNSDSASRLRRLLVVRLGG